MKPKMIFTLLLLLYLTVSAFANGQIEFAKTYLEARQKAIEENKPYIIIFENKDCKPCEWMEKNSLRDREVQQVIENEYIAVKVDIDDFDGYALKKYYEIKKIPSLLIFSPKGVERQRIEQALTASEMLPILKDPKASVKIESRTAPEVEEKTSTVPDKPSREEHRAAGSYYAVQLGVFSNQTNAQELVDRVKRISSEKVTIQQEGEQFKVFSGQLDSKSAAEGHLRKLKDYGYDGFIKSVSQTSKL